MSERHWKLCLLTAAAALALGCGPKIPEGVQVHLRVLQNGAPLEVPGSQVGLGYVEVVLRPAGGGAAEYAMANPDGSVTFIGQEKGISPGQYAVAVYQRTEGPESDLLEGAYSLENTPITIDVDSARVGKIQDLGTIDLKDYPPS